VSGPSILHPGAGAAAGAPADPECLADLRLDHISAALTAGRAEYDLAPLFAAPLSDADAVAYRQEVVTDLRRTPVREAVAGFAGRMRAMRSHTAQAARVHDGHGRRLWELDAASAYCAAVTGLAAGLAAAAPSSRGLQAIAAHLDAHTGSEPFGRLRAGAEALAADVAAARYTVHIQGTRVRVAPFAGQADYGAEVRSVFARFRRPGARERPLQPPGSAGMDRVEEQVLEGVARIHPGVFARLDGYAERLAGAVDPAIVAFDREVQLFVGYLELVERLERAGLELCLPRIAAPGEAIAAAGAFDLALADRVVPHGTVVRNGFRLDPPERILVVTGPNQGGKTTFARMFGQLHHLAALGLPVPAREAVLALPDRIFTHFERPEDVATLRGKLDEELVRMRETFAAATDASIVVMNESFTSTALADALAIGADVIERLAELGAAAVCVTFVDELASLGAATVSMVAGVDPADPAVRTFRIDRRPADGLAHAWAIAEKHGLTYERVRDRIGP